MANKAKTAASGAYGAPVWSRTNEAADILLKSITSQLHDVDYFTREDLLHLPAFDHVSTITRYRYVCDAVKLLLERGKLHAKSNTELAVTGKQRRYRPISYQVAEYQQTVLYLARDYYNRVSTSFGISQLLSRWKTDTHLTENVKRVIIRHCLRALVKEGLLVRNGLNNYSVKG